MEEDTELTRKAIDELMKEMNEYKEREDIPTERKKNPLGRPNKLFLGRTINSILKHNKRQSDRNLQRCERKLKELDEMQRKHKVSKRQRSRRNAENLHEAISSDSCNDAYKNILSKNMRKKKKRKRRRISSSSSSSAISSSTHTSSGSSGTSLKIKNVYRKKKRKKAAKEYRKEFCSVDYDIDNTIECYVDPNMAYAAMAYGQLNHMMQQQQLFQEHINRKGVEESVEIPSDLNISCNSSPESSLNISLNSSSAEEDENGILTFKLSSDEDENVSRIYGKDQKSPKINKNNDELFLDIEDSVHSHISVESRDSQKSDIKQSDEIFVLSTSSSDSEELQIVETTENVNK